MSPATVTPTAIPGLVVLETKHIPDDRGAVREMFRASEWEALGLPELGSWQQVNVTTSHRGVIRGLHGEPMSKLVGVVAGSAFGAYVDTRPASPAFGEVVTVDLTLGRQVFVPNGVCNGFQTTSDLSVYVYCFDEEWRPDMPGTAVHPLDPDLAIPWPLAVDEHVHLSAKDRGLPRLRSLPSR